MHYKHDALLAVTSINAPFQLQVSGLTISSLSAYLLINIDCQRIRTKLNCLT